MDPNQTHLQVCLKANAFQKYEGMVVAGVLNEDPEQRAIAAELTNLWSQLPGYEAAMKVT